MSTFIFLIVELYLEAEDSEVVSVILLKKKLYIIL